MTKIPAKKSLGQNFLKDENVLKKIANTIETNENDIIIEIGPGKGALTKYLVPKKGKLICYEIDERMKDILQKADRMTMANSLEGRVPFVDKEVFKIASSLPLNYKVTKENTKVALRDAAKKVIPNESYKKKKLGFPVPIRDWMREDDVYKEIKKTFNSKVCKKYFDKDLLIKMLDEHKNGKKDNYRKVWNVYCFIKWYNVFFA